MSGDRLNRTGCVITVSDFTGDVLCRLPGPECDCSMSKHDYDQGYSPGLTSDGVVIRAGLHVITNEWRAGIVLDRLHLGGWFDVRYADGRTVMQNGERVATVVLASATERIDARAEYEREMRSAS